MGQPGLGLCLTWTRPDRLWWEKSEPAIDQFRASDQPDWVLSVSSAYRAVSGLLQGV